MTGLNAWLIKLYLDSLINSHTSTYSLVLFGSIILSFQFIILIR